MWYQKVVASRWPCGLLRSMANRRQTYSMDNRRCQWTWWTTTWINSIKCRRPMWCVEVDNVTVFRTCAHIRNHPFLWPILICIQAIEQFLKNHHTNDKRKLSWKSKYLCKISCDYKSLKFTKPYTNKTKRNKNDNRSRKKDLSKKQKQKQNQTLNKCCW